MMEHDRKIPRKWHKVTENDSIWQKFLQTWRIMTENEQTWNLSKNLHRRILRLKILHRQFHLISTVLVGKNTKNEWKWRNLLRWQKFYTAAGTDGMDKFHLWLPAMISFQIAIVIANIIIAITIWIILGLLPLVAQQCSEERDLSPDFNMRRNAGERPTSNVLHIARWLLF